jgi:glycosyltransferase involved in cell wall biosynthesis
VGLADLGAKNELLGNSMAMLFPIKWNEPFGLVMVEAMACGTPVVASPGGSVPEIVRDGISGFICRSVVEMAKRVTDIQASPLSPHRIRNYVVKNFSVQRMVARYAGVYEEALIHAEDHRIA